MALKERLKYVGFVIHWQIEKNSFCAKIVQNPFEFFIDLVIAVTFVEFGRFVQFFDGCFSESFFIHETLYLRLNLIHYNAVLY